MSSTTTAAAAQGRQNQSIDQFLGTIWVGAVVCVAQVIGFMILRKKFLRFYEPRSFLVPEKKRVPIPKSGYFDWLKPIFRTKNPEFITKSGLDAYFFLRFLRMLVKMVLCLTVVLLPVLLPINAHGGLNTLPSKPVAGLDIFSWSNISPARNYLHTAHLIMALFVIFVFCYIVYDELRGYVRLRQAFLTSPQHRMRASATTVLVTSVPMRWMSQDAMVNLYDVFPGGLKNVWLNRDYGELQDKIDERAKIALELESAETNLIKKCRKKKLAMDKEDANKNKGKAGVKPDTNSVEMTSTSSRDESNLGTAAGVPRTLSEEENTAEFRKKRRGLGFPLPAIHKVVDDVKKVGDNVKVAGENIGDQVALVLPNPNRLGYDENLVSNDDGNGISLGEPDHDAEDARTGYTTHVPRNNDDEHNPESIPGTPELGSQTHPNSSAAVNGAGSSIPQRMKSLNPARAVPKWKAWAKAKQSGYTDNPDASTDSDAIPLSTTTPKQDAYEEPPESPILTKQERDENYPRAYDEDLSEDKQGEPVWKKYIAEKDRETMKISASGKKSYLDFLNFLPFRGRKVDKIYHLRRQIARLNVEIETDQARPESYPLMNSVFIQFHSQIAAHMACQALNHHVPQHMAPRYLEINPRDVLWQNMRLKWWERYVRFAVITIIVAGMIIFWAIPTTFVGSLSSISTLAGQYTWLRWLLKIPNPWLGYIQGILPPALLGALLALLPLILRLLAKYQGNHTTIQVELAVQNWYFSFLFIQVFLVVTISSSIFKIIKQISQTPGQTPNILAENIPKSSNFFFSYLLLQAFGTSGGTLLQIFGLILAAVFKPFKTTARQKWKTAVGLNAMQWGTLFPVVTNLAVITISYATIAPLILPWALILFSLFWVVYRYNLIFVLDPVSDSGGLPFPKAINHLFTGLYVMEICLIGLFLTARNAENKFVNYPHVVVMVVAVVGTGIYQFLLNQAFSPLFEFLPVTLEDDAADAEEAYAKRWAKSKDEYKRLTTMNEQPERNGDQDESIEDTLKKREQAEEDADRQVADREQQNYEAQHPDAEKKSKSKEPKVEEKKKKKYTLKEKLEFKYNRLKEGTMKSDKDIGNLRDAVTKADEENDFQAQQEDLERQKKRSGATGRLALFDHIADELEDLSPEQRDALVDRAFQHEALRAHRPCIWIPRDELGVSDDEIRRTGMVSDNIWVSNQYTGFDVKNRVTFGRSPPDYDERDIIDL